MSRDITLLHPEVQVIIPKFLEECKKRGLIVKTTDTVRTKQEQDKLYAQGRTEAGKIVTWVKYPYSNHNWGMAFDICRNDGKGAYNDSDNWFRKVGEVGKKFGLEWGGDWKGTPDKPHFELTKYGSTNDLVKKYTTPENFRKTWKPMEIEKEEKPKYMIVERNYNYNNKIKSLKVINENGENYVKIRDIAELLNKNIKYDNNTKITSLDDIVENKKIIDNNKEITIKCVNLNGSNYMNAREIEDALGYEVGYNEIAKIVYFKVKNTILNKLKLLKSRC